MNHYQPEVAQPKWAQVYSTCCKTITTLMGNHTSLQNLRKDSYELESSIGACPKLK